jgi:hypothetical protein
MVMAVWGMVPGKLGFRKTCNKWTGTESFKTLFLVKEVLQR